MPITRPFIAAEKTGALRPNRNGGPDGGKQQAREEREPVTAGRVFRKRSSFEHEQTEKYGNSESDGMGDHFQSPSMPSFTLHEPIDYMHPPVARGLGFGLSLLRNGKGGESRSEPRSLDHNLKLCDVGDVFGNERAHLAPEQLDPVVAMDSPQTRLARAGDLHGLAGPGRGDIIKIALRASHLEPQRRHRSPPREHFLTQPYRAAAAASIALG
jgi:hypothetical protein